MKEKHLCRAEIPKDEPIKCQRSDISFIPVAAKSNLVSQLEDYQYQTCHVFYECANKCGEGD